MKKILIGFGIVLAFIVVVASCSASKDAGTSTPAPSNAPSGAPRGAAAPTDEADTARYGEGLSAGDMAVTVAKPKKTTQQYLGSQVCTKVSYKNNGSTPQPYGVFDWKFRTAAGAESSASIPMGSGTPLNSGELRPGGTVSGQVCSDSTVSDAEAVVYSPGLGVMYNLTWSE